MVNLLDFVGRVFISALFLFSAFNKILDYSGTIGWMESYGVPGFILGPTIGLEVVLPLLIIIGYQTRTASILLALFSCITAIIFHSDFSDQMQFISFMKNIALSGGFLFLVVNGAKGYCLDKK